MKTVQILLSSYNGEKYLREQLDSIINQIGVNIRIAVRDDGSTDATVDILEEYRKAGLLQYYAEKNVGYRKSFVKLANYCVGQADYYAFCDQDDVWEQNKLLVAVTKLEENSIGQFKLYFSNLNLVDENLESIGFKDFGKMNISFGGALARHSAAGCTMVFNENLLRLAFDADFIKKDEFFPFGHDAWVYKVCLGVGGNVIFDSNSYIKYRRHNDNVTVLQHGFKKRIMTELKSFRKDRRYIKSSCAEIILREYSDLIPEDNFKLLREISVYNKSIFNTIKLLYNKDLNFGIKTADIFTKIEILSRWY